MAPKAKREKLTEQQIQDLCLSYLTEQNRPYSARDVSLNLHDKITQAAAQKALQALAEKDEIVMRELGGTLDSESGTLKRSSLVFCARQDQKVMDAAGLAQLDAEAQDISEHLIKLKEENRQLEEVLKSICHERSTAELQRQDKLLDEEITSLKARLEPLEKQNAGRQVYSTEESLAIDKLYTHYRSAHKKHRKEFEDIFAAFCEGMEKNKAESLLWREELGIDEVDADEECRWLEDPLSAIAKKSKLER